MGETERYSRQVLLPSVGREGQRRLSRVRLLVVGLGALGCVSSDLMARAGVGHLILVDRDLVELSNLQRQTLYEEKDVDVPKTIAAQKRLSSVNSDIRIDALVKDLNPRTITPVMKEVDIVVDGTDNLRTRYLLNEACVKGGVPFVYGAALGVEGMCAILKPPETPCFRCLFPTPPPPGSLPTCETAGILNAVASMVGSAQASLALHYVLSGQLASHLYTVRAWGPGMESIQIRPRPECPTCSQGKFEHLESRGRVVTQLCGDRTVSVDPLLEEELSLENLAARLSKAGRVRLTPHVLLLSAPPYNLSIFPDGRAIIKGVPDENSATAVYERYIGL